MARIADTYSGLRSVGEMMTVGSSWDPESSPRHIRQVSGISDVRMSREALGISDPSPKICRNSLALGSVGYYTDDC